MASSSVSSEWAFSQGGITVSKCQNCLKADIVEALQCVKGAICHNLLFHKVGPSSLVEDEPEESEELEIEGEAGEKADDNVEEEGWVDLILEDSEDSESDG